jgi:hypothetical protein
MLRAARKPIRRCSKLETTMLKRFLAASFVPFLSLIAIAVASVDAKTPATSKPAAVEAVRKLVAQDIGAPDDSIEILKKGKVLTITRVNSALNESNHQSRNDDAASIMAVVAKAIVDKAEFKSLYNINVQYTSRAEAASKSKIIDTIEFRKNQKGVFEMHLT